MYNRTTKKSRLNLQTIKRLKHRDKKRTRGRVELICLTNIQFYIIIHYSDNYGL